MNKYIKPESTVVTIGNDSLMMNYSNNYNENNYNLAKPNPKVDPSILDKNGVW